MTEFGRIMALDVGDVRTGVAMSDPMRMIASPQGTVQMASMDAALAELKQIIADYEPVTIVVGIPLNQHGQPGPQAEKTLAFVEQLKTITDITIETQDERFSTASAQRMLISAKVKRKKRKQVVDKIAATHILQAYLDRLASGPTGSR